MGPREYKGPRGRWPETLCPASLRLPSTMTAAPRCACALALMCLVLLLCPDGTLGEELELQPHPSPRAAYWLPSFGQFNKYIEKLFNSSLKPKNTKKPKDEKNTKKTPPANATKPLSVNATTLPQRNITNAPPRNIAKP